MLITLQLFFQDWVQLVKYTFLKWFEDWSLQSYGAIVLRVFFYPLHFVTMNKFILLPSGRNCPTDNKFLKWDAAEICPVLSFYLKYHPTRSRRGYLWMYNFEITLSGNLRKMKCLFIKISWYHFNIQVSNRPKFRHGNVVAKLMSWNF